MTILTFASHIVRHLGNSRARTDRRLHREIARYPESVRNDLGWPVLVEHPDEKPAKTIRRHEVEQETRKGLRPFRIV